ncbi:UNVERIFIED_CONTAM: hypothetical protein RMT77_002598 [Armadillidium vulgare]
MSHHLARNIGLIKPFLQRSFLPCSFQVFSFRLKSLKFQRNAFSTSINSRLLKDTSDISEDPKLQELIKEMYVDFNITEESKDDLQEEKEDSLESVEKADFDNKNDVDYDAEIIYDYDEERLLRAQGLWTEVVKKKKPVEEDIVYKRGITGVFDVEELIETLKKEKAQDIATIRVPPEIQYADYLIFASGKSKRHSSVLAELIIKLHKKKKNKKDFYPKVEGKNSEWVSIDMGNIVLHLMSEDTRMEKDLETLWTVGGQYDEEAQKYWDSVNYKKEQV